MELIKKIFSFFTRTRKNSKKYLKYRKRNKKTKRRLKIIRGG